MAIVKKLEKIDVERDSKHTEVDATYAIVETEGQKFLPIDTYGSATCKVPGKKSQSPRFSPEALKQIKSIIELEL